MKIIVVVEQPLPEFESRTSSEFKLSDLLAGINSEEIARRLKKLDSNKAQGADGVNSHVLKMSVDSLVKPLEIIFKRSVSEGVVPNKWKIANVTPIFKKGSRIEAANYRPVSLTSVVCRLLEGIIRDKFMEFLIKNNLIAEEQHGFVRKKGCVTNLLETLDYVSSMLAEGLSIDIIFLDFLKAFDMVAHLRLLLKLEAYGVHGSLLEWFKSFLFNRRQRVVLGEWVSEWSEVTSGVPQGLVLG
jgi:hypothetical protein